MKNIKYILFLMIFFCAANLQAQKIARTAYFMKTLDRTGINPALRPDQGYIGIPALGNVYVTGMTNTINLDHFIFPGNNEMVTFMHRDVSIADFLDGMKDKNYLSADANVSLLSAGWYRGDAFWTVDLSVRAHVDGTVPKTLFEFAKIGYREDEPYNMKDARVIGNGFGELGVGYSRPFLNNTLILGAKAKFLIGLADFDAKVDQLNLSMNPDQWTAISRATIKSSVPGLSPKYDEEGKFDGFDYDSEFSISGYGFGLDIGGEYSLSGFADVLPILEKFKVSASFNDIGFIAWSKKNALMMTSPETAVILAGAAPGAPSPEDPSLEKQLDNLLDNLERAIDFQEDEAKSHTTTLRMSMNWAVEYEILKDKLSAGLLSSTYFNHSHTQTELTVSGNYMPLDWLAASLSYSFMYSDFKTFGFALHLAPSKGLNFFLAGDYIIPHVNSDWIPTSSRGVNAQIGLSIPLGARR